MRVIVQVCKDAKCEVANKLTGKSNYGLMVLVGFTEGDNLDNIIKMANKISKLRIFPDENGVMNKSIIDVNGTILSISQFTLYADCNKGRRPSYVKALAGDRSIKLYDEFNEKISNKNIKVQTGIFGEDMEILLVNDGPVTIMLERENDNEKK